MLLALQMALFSFFDFVFSLVLFIFVSQVFGAHK